MVPKTPIMPEPDNPKKYKDSYLKTYHRKLLQRKEWMKRLGLATNNPHQWLEICDRHIIEKQKVDFFWTNINNETRQDSGWIIVPRNFDEAEIKTRAQKAVRKEAPMRKRANRSYSPKIDPKNNKEKKRSYRS
jgi:hypothetical protein